MLPRLDFETLLHKAFGNSLPAHAIWNQHENLKQTGSVADLVKDLTCLATELPCTLFAPSEYDVISRFHKIVRRM